MGIRRCGVGVGRREEERTEGLGHLFLRQRPIALENSVRLLPGGHKLPSKSDLLDWAIAGHSEGLERAPADTPVAGGFSHNPLVIFPSRF